MHFDEHLTTRLRDAGKPMLLFWRMFATYGIVVLFACGVLMIFSGRVPWYSLLLPVALTHAITLGLQLIIRRPRPAIAHSAIAMWFRTPSFPSAHSAGSMAFAVATSAVFLDGSTFGVWASVSVFVLALLIGISRIMVGVHYVTDVLVGCIFGIVVSWIFLSVATSSVM